ncbi:MAG: GWxTD domain-containing protein [Gemmatimonadota bacterium]
MNHPRPPRTPRISPPPLWHAAGRSCGLSGVLLVLVLLAPARPLHAQDAGAEAGGEVDATAVDEAGERDRLREETPPASPADEAALEERREQIGAAEAERRELALGDVSPRVREAYAALEAGEARGDEDGLDWVKDLLEEEVRSGRNVARAYDGLGRYDLLQHEHAITILESIQKLFDWDHVSQARRNFRLATEADPGYVDAWYNWGVAGRKAGDGDPLREAAVALRKAVRLDPGYRDAYRLLAVTLRELGDVAGSERALAEWRASVASAPSLADLEESYLKMAFQNEPAEGATLYWRGLAATRTAEEAGAYLDDFKAILEGDEIDAFEELDPEGRRAWIAAFWQREADAAVVTRDERLAEHYRRLAHVHRNYALRIPQRRHYSAITAYRPREQSGYDDRGVVYLRHGSPDDVARSAGANVQRNESWLYRRPAGDLIFHFVSDEDTEDFKLVTSLTSALVRGGATLGTGRNTAEGVGDLFQSRSRLDPIYSRLAFQFDPMLLSEEEEQVARDVKVGTSSVTYVPESPDSLAFYAYAAAFRDAGGAPELALYYGVPTKELEMPEGTDGTRFAFAAQVIVADEESGEQVAARAVDSLLVQVPRAPSRDAGVLVPDVLRTPVPPGEYRARLRVRDLLSRATGTWSGEVDVPEPGGFSASSLVLASRIESSSGGGKFDRGGLKVVPLPSLAFRAGQPIYVYYEIYGLTPAEDGRMRYRTEYTVRTRERKRNIAMKVLGSVGNLVGSRQERGEEVGLSVDGEAPAAERIREYISLDLQQSEGGPYELVVEIEDLETGREVTRSISFVLVA